MRAAHGKGAAKRGRLKDLLFATVAAVSLSAGGFATALAAVPDPASTGGQPDSAGARDIEKLLTDAIEGDPELLAPGDGGAGTEGEESGQVGSDGGPSGDDGTSQDSGKGEGVDQGGTGDDGAGDGGLTGQSTPDSSAIPSPGLAAKTRSGDGGISPLADDDAVAWVKVNARVFSSGYGSPSVGNDAARTTGMAFELYESVSGNAADNTRGAATGWTCEITGNSGACSIPIPASGVGERYWVKQIAAPADQFMLNNLRVNGASADTKINYPSGRTPAVQAGQTYDMPRLYSTTPSNQFPNAARDGSWGAIVGGLNNDARTTCQALTIAVQVDVSTSITASQMAIYKAGLLDGIEGLRGTGTKLALFNFATSSPQVDPTLPGNKTEPLSVDDDDERAELIEWVNKLTASSGVTRYTNWQAAITAVANSGYDYDTLLFITDGAPNRTNGYPTGNSASVRAVEGAMYAANAYKKSGSRIVAVGVNVAQDIVDFNLTAIADEDDAYVARNFEDLGGLLVDLGKELTTCSANIDLFKYVGNDISDSTWKPGWEFQGELSGSGSQAALEPADGEVTTGASESEPGRLKVVFDDKDGQANVNISEVASQDPSLELQKVQVRKWNVNQWGSWSDLTVDEEQTLDGVGFGDEYQVRFFNNYADVDVTKSIESVEQDGDQWKVTYKVSVENETDRDTFYKLEDTLKFGGNVTADVPKSLWSTTESLKDFDTDAALPTSGGFAGSPPKATLAENARIAGGATHEFTVVAYADVEFTDDNTSLQCSEEPGGSGGFLNEATVTSPVDEHTVEACQSVATLRVDKVGLSATKQPGPALVYDLKYQIDVTNSVSEELSYELTDEPPTLPAGVTLTGDWRVEAGSSAGTIVQAEKGTNDPWKLATGTLEPESKHTYYVTAEVTVDRAVAQGDQECADTDTRGLVLVNGATITSGDFTDSAEGCVAIEMTQINMEKTVESAEYDVDTGEWTVTYQVDVQLPNTGTEEDPHYGRTTYNLVDTLNFGAGITVESAEWEVTGANSPPLGATSGDFDSDTWSAAMANSRPIGGSGNSPHHVYTITVVATADFEATGSKLECAEEGSEGGGGFLNTASLSYSGGELEDDACSSPDTPKVSKTGVSAELGADGETWTLTYRVQVSNTADTDLPFTLTDQLPTMPTGVERVSVWSVVATDGGPLDSSMYVGEGQWTFVEDGTIPGKSEYTYELSTNVQLSTDVSKAAAGQCADTETSGILFPNQVTLTSIGDEKTDDGCVTIPVTRMVVTKVWDSSTQKSDGSWDVSYTLVVSNREPVATVYDLTDEIRFDTEWMTVLGGTWSGAGTTGGDIDPGATSVEIAEAKPIAAYPGEESEHTYSVTINVDVDPRIWDSEEWGGELDPTQCEADGGPDNGGFLNAALLQWVGGEDEDQACEPPRLPGVMKEFLSAEQSETDPDLWSVSYAIYTFGTQGFTSFHGDIYDEPGFPDGVQLIEGHWSTPYPGPATDSGTIEMEGTDAWVVQKDVLIPENGMKRYLVTWDVELTGDVSQESLECDADSGAGHGFFNEARLVSGGFTQDSSACGPISEVVNPTVEKSVTSTSQNDDGSWDIVYEVEVTLPTGEVNPDELSAKYDLVDTLDFGEGLVPTAATWQQVGPGSAGAVANFDSATWSAELATGKTITPEAPVHTYQVKVTAEAESEAFSGGTAYCSSESDEASGFLNRVTITTKTGPTEKQVCTDPAAPSISKTGLPVVDNSDGTWTVSYEVAVSNQSETDLAYRLVDRPEDLPGGVVLEGDWAAEAADQVTEDAGLPLTASAPTTGEWVLAEGTLPAGETYTFVVSAAVSLDLSELSTDLDGSCPGADVGGIPLLNSAGVVSGQFEAEADACTPIPLSDVDVEKTWVSSTQTELDGTWSVVYDVTVTNTGSAGTVYDLSDNVRFDGTNISLVSASWGGETSGSFADGASSAVLATGRYLLAGDSHTYTVTAIATVSGEAWESPASLTCESAGGNEGAGFLNQAAVTFPGGAGEDQDCASPGRPTVSKDGVSATQSDGDPELWNVNYTITVDGRSLSGTTLYEVVDVPEFAEGVTPVGGTASLRGGSAGYQDLELGASGGVIATDVELPAGQVHVWDVSWEATLSGTTPPEALECNADGSPGGGFFNSATLSTGETARDVSACLPIQELVRPEMNKTVESTSQNSDGSWAIEYRVTVTLPTGDLNPGDLSAKYDLVDELDFGEGLTPTAATWQQVQPGPAGSVADFDSATWSVQMAAGKTITPEDPVHAYRVKVTAEAETGAFLDGTAYCGSEPEGESSGFLNTVVMTSAGADSQASACSDPAAPWIAKTGLPATQNDDGSWNIQYRVEVVNDNDISVVYELTDSPEALPTGVTLVQNTTWTAEAVDVGADSSVTEAELRPGEDWVFAEGRLSPGSTDTYLVSAQVNVDYAELKPAQLPQECGPDEVGVPLLNVVSLVSGRVGLSDEACIPLPPATTWTLEKSSTPPSGSEIRPGQVITYKLTVKNTGDTKLVGAEVIDDLSGVVEHADPANEALAAGLVLSEDGKTLTWSVPTVGVGESVSVIYQVKVHGDARGVTLRNLAKPATMGGRCVEDACSTTHTVPAPGGPGGKPALPITGASVAAALGLSLLLGGGGYAALRASKRRGRENQS